jgi:choline dehydrogenase-like flavoprotein
MGRTNLRVLTDAAVDRVLLKERRAVGVRLLDGREFTGHEVIVSAGAIHSPALLLHSGVDTPGVGTGLKDHPSFPVMIRLSDDVAWDPHSLPVGIVGRASSGEEAADLQLLPMNHLGPSVPRAGLVMVALMEVRSQGRVSLVAGRSDAGLRPAIDFAMLADTTDMRRLGAGVEHLHRVFGTPSMRALGEPLFPPSDAVGLRTNLGDYVHAACTCAIGRVVDPSCRVIGYEGLRVGDASVMPDLPRANTHLTTVVIAERLAALIATGG